MAYIALHLLSTINKMNVKFPSQVDSTLREGQIMKVLTTTEMMAMMSLLV